jgi:RNA polymerase sigma-70 factor (ECF subfamily)
LAAGPANDGGPLTIDGSRLTDVGSPVTDVGSLVTDVGSRVTDVGSLVTDVGSPVTDVGSQVTDVGSQVTDVGSQLTDVGSQLTDVGSQLTDVGSQVTGVGGQAAETGTIAARFARRAARVGPPRPRSWSPGTVIGSPTAIDGAPRLEAGPSAQTIFPGPYPFAQGLRFPGMPPRSEPPAPLASALRVSWHAFLETYEPLRSDLYRYCRHLTRSPWDAEDLAQDAMARAFVTLGQMGDAPPNPRAWLFRVASNLWLDQLRRRRREVPLGDRDEGTAERDLHAPREAAGTLIGQLSPQERAAVVLKEAFDLSLEVIAEALSTTTGAVKAALHRGREKLVEPVEHETRGPAPGVLDAFCSAFNAGDLDRLTRLLLDSAAVEVVGATTQYGPEAARRTVLYGMLFGVERMATADRNGGIEARFMQRVLPSPPRVEVALHRGAWILVHWYAHEDGEAVRAITRVDPDVDRVARLRNYFFNPDFIAEVCGELGLPWRSNGYRWCLPS